MTGFLLHITFALFSIKTQDFPIINFVLRPRRKKKNAADTLVCCSAHYSEYGFEIFVFIVLKMAHLNHEVLSF